MASGEYSIHILTVQAEVAEGSDHFTKNGTVLKFALEVDDFEDKEKTKETSLKKSPGKLIEWKEVSVLRKYDSSKHTKLYVEVYDRDGSNDVPIAFAGITLQQANDAPGKSIRGKFPVYDDERKQYGTLALTITIVNTEHDGAKIINDNPEQQGTAELTTEHMKRLNPAKAEAEAAAAAAAAPPPEETPAEDEAAAEGETPAEGEAASTDAAAAPADAADAPADAAAAPADAAAAPADAAAAPADAAAAPADAAAAPADAAAAPAEGDKAA